MKEKILIVDDETEIADLVELYLQNEDFLVYKFTMQKKRGILWRRKSWIWLFWIL